MTKPGKMRQVGPEGIGSGGDVRDRLRGAYKPGNMKPIPSPMDSVESWVKKQIGKMKKQDPTSVVRPNELVNRKPTPRPSPRALDPTSAVRDGELKKLKKTK